MKCPAGIAEIAMQDWTMTDWKMTDGNGRIENGRLDTEILRHTYSNTASVSQVD